MRYEFDPAKDEANREKHGLSLAFGVRILNDPARITATQARPEDAEVRVKAVGDVAGKLYTAIFTWRGEVPRFISVRRSNNAEERAYRDPGRPG